MMKYAALIFSVLFSVACFGQGQIFLQATAAAGNLLLDDYPGAKAAFSVRKLDNDYVGNCLRVRRESDNAEQDIGFSGNDIDNAALTSFCSATNCRVVTWYDQSGNGLDATQASTAKQPIIASAGVIENINGVTALGFIIARNDNFLATYPSAVSQPTTYLFVAQSTSTAGFRFAFDGVDASRRQIFYNNGVGGNWVINAGAIGDAGIASDQNRHVFFALFNTVSSGLFIDGSTINNPISPGAGDVAGIRIGADYSGNTNGWNGYIQEMIIWDSNQSANRSAIETNTNNYFSIY